MLTPDGDRSAPRSAEDLVAVFMTSTYLILLAFFVVLTSISTLEPAKSEEVLESVTKAFGTGPSIFQGPSGAGSADTGVAEAARRYLEIGSLFETQLALAHVEQVQRGRLMLVSLPEEEIFEGGTLRPRASRLIDQVARVLGAPSKLTAYRIEYVEPPGGDAPIRRGGTVARALVEAGLPAEAVSIGVERVPAGSVRFVFRSTDRGAERIIFQSGF